MNTLSEDRRLADATRLCVGQRGAATTTEDMQRRHRFRVGRMGRLVKDAGEYGELHWKALRKLYGQPGGMHAHYNH
jgi:hypothetical protein